MAIGGSARPGTRRKRTSRIREGSEVAGEFSRSHVSSWFVRQRNSPAPRCRLQRQHERCTGASLSAACIASAMLCAPSKRWSSNLQLMVR